MIKDHVTFSARAENSRKLRSLLALTIGSVMSMTAYAAHGTEAPSLGSRTGAVEQIALPPIPYLDTMPWLTWRPASTMKVDTWLSPIPELPRLRVDPSPPDRSGSLPATS
ncbi:hypothetical protein JQ621_26360 [Bradyrhizobium manausense]|uniref:hypothetical protein n=1 Tax=Bradyrhizobium manausense TaxID=989370 RepID=UPI001BA99EC7|nr:hypothetical protein [Bradyrhizobium manausense]MBR1091000.1 hypothetical protein [Bradyrhizobium manausense]